MGRMSVSGWGEGVCLLLSNARVDVRRHFSSGRPKDRPTADTPAKAEVPQSYEVSQVSRYSRLNETWGRRAMVDAGRSIGHLGNAKDRKGSQKGNDDSLSIPSSCFPQPRKKKSQ